MATYLEPLRVSTPPTPEQIATIEGVLDAGARRCLLPVPEGDEGDRIVDAARIDEPLGAGVDAAVLAVATTGSTGTPKIVLHSRETLLASINATAEYLGGHGQWVLCLGINHIAGIQVVLRSAVAGASPITCPAGGAEFAARFTAAIEQLSSSRSYVSLVPTQLHRLIESGCQGALRHPSAILLGGAPADPALLRRCAADGITVVTTYGMSETGGGCVYDGAPLPGVTAAIDLDGVVSLSGPVLALGYRDSGDSAAFRTGTDGSPSRHEVRGAGTAEHASNRIFVTSDLGEVADGRLQILGRVDDLINTGGKKVAPQRVEAALRSLPSVADAVVVGVPDEQWGERVVALVVPTDRSSANRADAKRARYADEVRTELRSALSAAELPRDVLVVPELPLKGIGKPDRAAARSTALIALAQ